MVVDFPGAILAQKAVDISWIYRKRKVIYGMDLPKGFSETGDLDDGGHGIELRSVRCWQAIYLQKRVRIVGAVGFIFSTGGLQK